MRITKVETIPLKYPYDACIFDAKYSITHRQALLVVVHTDEAVCGVGEAASFGGPLSTTKAIIDCEIGPLVVGEDALNIERIWQKVYHRCFQHGRRGAVLCGLSGLDIALWDLVGKYLRTPLYKVFGAYRDRFRAYASGGFYQRGKSTRLLVDEMRRCVDAGFTAIKMKVGRNDTPGGTLDLLPYPDVRVSLEDDLERVRAVREAVGPGIQLMVDANGAWDVHTALVMGREFDRLRVYAFEEPTATDDLDGSAALARSLDLQIAGYETEQGIYGFRELVRNHAVDIVQPDVIWAGGFTECRKIAALAYAFNKICNPHCFSSAVSLLATMHFIGSTPNAELLEFDQNPNGLRDELLDEPIMADERGFVSIPDRPGLGLTLETGRLEKYREDK